MCLDQCDDDFISILVRFNGNTVNTIRLFLVPRVCTDRGLVREAKSANCVNNLKR